MKPLLTVYMHDHTPAYGFGSGHPFSTERYPAFIKAFFEHSFDQHVRLGQGTLALDEDLLRFHDVNFLNFVRLKSQQGMGYLDYGDTPAVRGISEAASYVVGTSVTALNEIMTGITDRAFVPIGGLHHGRPKSAAGFCVFNDIGVVIQRALDIYNLSSIFYVDIDAHFGDGVYYAFESDPRVQTFDWHQEHIFPGSGFENEVGTGSGRHSKRNICLKAGAEDQDIEPYLKDLYHQILKAQPGLILLQAGVDSLKGDPLGGLHLSLGTPKRVASMLGDLADQLGHGRVLAFGGGGYNLKNVTQGWCAVLQGLLHPSPFKSQT